MDLAECVYLKSKMTFNYVHKRTKSCHKCVSTYTQEAIALDHNAM